MNVITRYLYRRRLKQDNKQYHKGCRDTMTISDNEKKELSKSYDQKLTEKDEIIKELHEEIRELKKTLVDITKLQSKEEHKLIDLDAALSLILQSNEIQYSLHTTRYKNIMNTVDRAKIRINRVLKRLPKTQKAIEEKARGVL